MVLMKKDNLQEAIIATRDLLVELLQKEKYCDARQAGIALERLISLGDIGGGVASAMTATQTNNNLK